MWVRWLPLFVVEAHRHLPQYYYQVEGSSQATKHWKLWSSPEVVHFVNHQANSRVQNLQRLLLALVLSVPSFHRCNLSGSLRMWAQQMLDYDMVIRAWHILAQVILEWNSGHALYVYFYCRWHGMACLTCAFTTRWAHEYLPQNLECFMPRWVHTVKRNLWNFFPWALCLIKPCRIIPVMDYRACQRCWPMSASPVRGGKAREASGPGLAPTTARGGRLGLGEGAVWPGKLATSVTK